MLIKELCGPYLYPNKNEMKRIDRMIEERLKNDKESILDVISSYTENHIL